MEAVGVAGTQLLRVVIWDDGQAERRGDDLGGLPGAWERAGDKRAGGDLAGGGETVAQPLGLRDAQLGQPDIAANTRNRAIDIADGFTVSDQVEIRSVQPEIHAVALLRDGGREVRAQAASGRRVVAWSQETEDAPLITSPLVSRSFISGGWLLMCLRDVIR
jgi:hypothetical protein